MAVADGKVSAAVAGIEVSAIKRMAVLAARTPNAVSLAWGLPSFRTPPHIRAAAAAGLDSDPEIGKYALPDGLTALREAAARTHAAATGIAVDPARNVMIAAGNTQGLNALFHVLLDPGDEIVVTDPGFASHIQQIRLCGGRPVFWAMDEARGWALDLDSLDGLVTARTKAILLVTPSNPTGKVFSEAELRRVGEVARRRDLVILIDDPYSPFLYENRPRFFNLASVPELADRLCYLFTFSKAHAMSGWRLAYAILPEWLKREVLKVHDATIICTPRVSQVAGIAALTAPPTHFAEFEAVLARRRALICARLDRLDHLFSYVRPEGAYYVFPRILVPHRDSEDFAARLLAETGVSTTPGSAFGPTGEGHLRLAFCVEDAAIDEAFDRLEKRFPG